MLGIKITKFNLMFFFCSLLILSGLFYASSAHAGLYTGGLWGQYSEDDFNDYQQTVFKALEIENIDYANFSAHLNTVIGQPNDAHVVWKGYVLADTAGVYNFRIDQSSIRHQLTIDDTKLFLVPPNFWDVSGDWSANVNLTAGWHKIYVRATVPSVANSRFQMFWTPPGELEEIVPVDHLNYWHWSNSIVTIPSSGTEKVDFVTAGAGADGLLKPEIEIDLPAPLGDVLTDEAVLLWFKQKDDPDTLVVTNEQIPGTQVLETGTAFEAVYHDRSGPVSKPYRQMHARLDPSLIDDGGSGRLRLSVEKSAGVAEPRFNNGIVLFLPFRDPLLPGPGTLTLRMIAASAYHGVGPVMTFPVSGAVVDPVFVFENGETKIVSTQVPPRYRPNYLYMLTGSGSPPSIDTLLKNQPGAQMIIPQQTPLDLNNPDTWYPDYGREGAQIDTLSSKYVPNLWGTVQAQYKNQQEGVIFPAGIPIPPGDTWVAFQYIGSNFPADGVDGSGESGSIACGGMFITSALENDLNASVSGDGIMTSDPVGINCPGDCDETYVDGTVVELTATPNGASSFLGWTGDCTGLNPVCYIVMDRAQTVGANFSASVPGKCGSAVDHSTCLEPQAGFCGAFNVRSNYLPSGSGWQWRCTGTDGTFEDCVVERQCGWVESH